MSSLITVYSRNEEHGLHRGSALHRGHAPWKSGNHRPCAAFSKHPFDEDYFRHLITNVEESYTPAFTVKEFEVAKKTVVSGMLVQNITAFGECLLRNVPLFQYPVGRRCAKKIVLAYLLWAVQPYATFV